MSNEVFNLDDGVQEYTEFMLLGKKYSFRQFNTQEIEEVQILGAKADSVDANNFISKFITPMEGSPSFEEIKPKLLIGHWKNLNKMIFAIMGIDEQNKGTESTTENATN